MLPPNRLREVRRLQTGQGTWFVKRFRGIQTKNRVRNAWTRPRCQDDATREAEMSRALRAAGIDAPRPVFLGSDGESRLYVCAELPGRPIVDLLSEGSVAQPLADAAADFAGSVFARGFSLPDLSADHLFVRTEGGETIFGVLDLHNGTLRRRVSAKDVRRSLRRFRRSVKELELAPRPVLRFALRFLRATGLPLATRRRILKRFPPLDTAARYASDRADRYAARNPTRAKAEAALLDRVWPDLRDHTVLDAPCGAGRLHAFVAERGGHWHGADRSIGMLGHAHDNSGSAVTRADATELPFSDRAFDSTVCFRFLHHVDGDIRRKVLTELCRVAESEVVVSFFHPVSTHHLRRVIRQRLSGQAATRHAVRLSKLEREMAAHGFTLEKSVAQTRFLRDLWIARFVRQS